MSDLREYVVEVDSSRDNIYLVSAKNAKEAINIVWEDVFKISNEWDKEHGYNPFTKCDLHAKSVGSLHNRDGKIVCLH